jgi:hypothetical protein
MLLRLAHQFKSAFLVITPAIPLTHGGLLFMESAPVVIVFTKYDRLVRTKRDELQEEDSSLSGDVLRERSREKAQIAFDKCVRSLERTLRETNTPKPNHVQVSGIYFLLFIWIRVDMSPQTNQATKLPSRLSFKSLATASATSSK